MAVKHEFEQIPVTTLANGFEVKLPIHRYTGGSRDDIIGISAAVHGDETPGVEILRRLDAIIRKQELNGTIVLLPTANVLAYQALTRNTPLDMVNLNRVFPGDPDGWYTEKLAHVITEEFLKQIDYFVDLHGGGHLATVDYVYIMNQEEMSRSFGSRLLYRPTRRFHGSTATVTSELDIPSVTVELGGGFQDDEGFVERGVSGVLNILRLLKFIPGEPTPLPEQIVMTELTYMRPHVGGILVPAVTLGDLTKSVPQGALLGTIYSPQSFELLEEIRAPYEENLMVLLRNTITRIEPGDYMYMVGNGATAERRR